MLSKPDIAAENAAVTRVPTDTTSSTGPEAEEISQGLDEITSAAAKAARDYRSWMLESIKLNINTALAYADRLATATLDTGLAERAVEQGGPEKTSGTPQSEGQPLLSAKAAEKYRAQAFELMAANVSATLDYAQKLASVRSPGEFVELSADQARKNLELIMKHAAALGVLSQSLMTNSAEQVTAGIAKVWNKHSG